MATVAESAVNMVKRIKTLPDKEVTLRLTHAPVLLLSMFPIWLENDVNAKLDALQNRLLLPNQ